MTSDKEKALNDTLEQAILIGFGLAPVENLEKIFAQKIMVIGTAVEEKYTSLDGLRELINMQKEQSAGLELSYTRNEVYRDLPVNEKIAIIVEDIHLTIKVNNDVTGFDMRASAILEDKGDQWQVIHWHVSKPDNVQSDIDTYGIEEWKQKADALEKLVAERTAEITRQKEELEHTLHDLRTTQDQLIQSEKMASLGELTAGIAHEIQNPLNFVNNFSEVSIELLDEMKIELNNGNTQDAKYIADDVIQNLQKINHHGKRADSIVKGMLQHSRSSTGQKEPTDINALADEYLRLAYHGIRAKDKMFNATLNTDFDVTIGKVNIISQDIGRVMLNLITNAFYAVNEKKKNNPALADGKAFEPSVTVSTKKVNSVAGDFILIAVKDNGNGIPQQIADKIFQPFFTTKPTGEGTGLGLSISYDIVKAHSGELTVETIATEGTTFTIKLPA